MTPTGRPQLRLPRLAAGPLAGLADAIEHLPEALVVWDADDGLVICNRRYAELFPEPSFVRPRVTFDQLVELNIDTGNVESFASVQDVRGAPARYRRARRQAHAAGRGANRLRLADGRCLQVSERPTGRGGVVGIYIDVTASRWPQAPASTLDLGPRQGEILQYVQDGWPNRAIAARLGLAEQTVKNHVSRLIRRFDARNRGHLVWLTRSAAPAARPRY